MAHASIPALQFSFSISRSKSAPSQPSRPHRKRTAGPDATKTTIIRSARYVNTPFTRHTYTSAKCLTTVFPPAGPFASQGLASRAIDGLSWKHTRPYRRYATKNGTFHQPGTAQEPFSLESPVFGHGYTIRNANWITGSAGAMLPMNLQWPVSAFPNRSSQIRIGQGFRRGDERVLAREVIQHS